MKKTINMGLVIVAVAIAAVAVPLSWTTPAMADRNQQPYGELVRESAKNPGQCCGTDNFGEFRSGLAQYEKDQGSSLGKLIKSEKGYLHNIH